MCEYSFTALARLIILRAGAEAVQEGDCRVDDRYHRVSILLLYSSGPNAAPALCRGERGACAEVCAPPPIRVEHIALATGVCAAPSTPSKSTLHQHQKCTRHSALEYIALAPAVYTAPAPLDEPSSPNTSQMSLVECGHLGHFLVRDFKSFSRDSQSCTQFKCNVQPVIGFGSIEGGANLDRPANRVSHAGAPLSKEHAHEGAYLDQSYSFEAKKWSFGRCFFEMSRSPCFACLCVNRVAMNSNQFKIWMVSDDVKSLAWLPSTSPFLGQNQRRNNGGQ